MRHSKVILVTYPDEFIINEARCLAESFHKYEIVMVFTQKYLDLAKYGMGLGKAEEIKEFTQNCVTVNTNLKFVFEL